MYSQHGFWEIPKLLVVGRMRVGKGTFISTSHRFLEARDLPLDIISHSAVSHTKEPATHSMRLKGCDVEMIDTVGFDDSSAENVSQSTLLRFLSDTKRAAFYPPLVMLTTLSALEKDLLKKMEGVFSNIVVAFRMSNGNKLELIEKEVLDCGIKPVKIFHLQEFVAEDLDPVGIIRKKYERNVSEILSFYETLSPTRDHLDFTKPMFAGDRRLQLHQIERKEEINIKERSATNEEAVFIKRAFAAEHRLQTGARLAGSAGAVGMCAVTAAILPTLRASVPIVGLAAFAPAMCKSAATWQRKPKDVELNTVVVEKWRQTYEKKVYEVWKILTGEIEIFTGYEKGEWVVVSKELLESEFK